MGNALSLNLSVEHDFAEGVYSRRLFIPAGVLVVGKVHKRQTLNICASGDITIWTSKGTRRFVAGDVVVSEPGIMKIGYAHKDTVWVNVHPTDLRDLAEIEKEFVRNPTPQEFNTVEQFKARLLTEVKE